MDIFQGFSENMSRPKLSVVIASRDISKTIKECLNSLERQKDRNLAEIIVSILNQILPTIITVSIRDDKPEQ